MGVLRVRTVLQELMGRGVLLGMMASPYLDLVGLLDQKVHQDVLVAQVQLVNKARKVSLEKLLEDGDLVLAKLDAVNWMDETANDMFQADVGDIGSKLAGVQQGLSRDQSSTADAVSELNRVREDARTFYQKASGAKQILAGTAEDPVNTSVNESLKSAAVEGHALLTALVVAGFFKEQV